MSEYYQATSTAGELTRQEASGQSQGTLFEYLVFFGHEVVYGIIVTGDLVLLGHAVWGTRLRLAFHSWYTRRTTLTIIVEGLARLAKLSPFGEKTLPKESASQIGRSLAFKWDIYEN